MIFFIMICTELVVTSAWKFTSYYEQISLILLRATTNLAELDVFLTVHHELTIH